MPHDLLTQTLIERGNPARERWEGESVQAVWHAAHALQAHHVLARSVFMRLHRHRRCSVLHPPEDQQSAQRLARRGTAARRGRLL